MSTTFTYVDAGAVTLEAFGTHLRAYLGLFQALPKLEFIYLALTARLFQAAESEFYHTLHGVRDHAKSVSVLDYSAFAGLGKQKNVWRALTWYR